MNPLEKRIGRLERSGGDAAKRITTIEHRIVAPSPNGPVLIEIRRSVLMPDGSWQTSTEVPA